MKRQRKGTFVVKEGDLVLLHKLISVVGRTKKLNPVFAGPYRVVQKLNSFIYPIEHVQKGERLDVNGIRLRVFKPYEDPLVNEDVRT